MRGTRISTMAGSNQGKKEGRAGRTDGRTDGEGRRGGGVGGGIFLLRQPSVQSTSSLARSFMFTYSSGMPRRREGGKGKGEGEGGIGDMNGGYSAR